jgi:hypothetical protein
MDDLVDHSLGGSLEFGVHGAALLRLGGFWHGLARDGFGQIRGSRHLLEPIRRFRASRTWNNGITLGTLAL